MSQICQLKFTAPLTAGAPAAWASGVYNAVIPQPGPLLAANHPPLGVAVPMAASSEVNFELSVDRTINDGLMPAATIMFIPRNWPVECGKSIRMELGQSFTEDRKTAGIETVPQNYKYLKSARVMFTDEGVLELNGQGLSFSYDLRVMSTSTVAQEYSVVIGPAVGSTVTILQNGAVTTVAG